MAFDAFLKIEGIRGESTDRAHPDEIEIESFSWGETNTGSAGGGGGGGAGKAVAQDFHFTMATSKASPNLMLACATGRHLPQAVLTCRKSGGSGIEFLKIKLSDIIVSSYDIGSHLLDEGYSLLAGDESGPTDQMSLNFVKIDFLYTVERTGETVETTFDFTAFTGA
jgi:type VI secretion system secreted protein Hcp